MRFNLLLISITKILTFSLLDRCKLYNINVGDCQNSVYVPNSSYDAYLNSFNLPVQKDPECAKKNCVIVVYKDPARISVNTSHDPSKPSCNLQNASDCISNTQTIPNELKKPEPQIIIHKSVITDKDSSENSGKKKKKKHEESDSDESEEEDKKKKKKKRVTVTQTITESAPNTETENKTVSANQNKTEKECSEEKPKQTESVPKTVTIQATEGPKATQTEGQKTVTVTVGQPETDKSTVLPPKETIKIPPTVQPSVISPETRPTEPQKVTTEIQTVDDRNELKKDLSEMKTLLKDRICDEDGNSCEIKRKKKSKKKSEKCEENCLEEDESDEIETSTNKKEKLEEKVEEKSAKKKKNKTLTEDGPAVTLTRIKTVTVTDEVPITLYREIEKTITKDNTITRYKVMTDYKTVSIEKPTNESEEKPTPIKPETVPPIVTLPISSSDKIATTAKLTESTPTESKTIETKPIESEAKTKTEKIPEIPTKPESLEDLLDKYYEKRPDPVVKIPQPEPTVSKPVSTKDEPKKDKQPTAQITEKKKEAENDLSKNLLPLFGQLLQKITKESIEKVKKPEEIVAKPEIKTVMLTSTEFVTETIKEPAVTCEPSENKKEESKPTDCVNKPDEKKKEPRIVYHTVYKKAPMKMKCKPVINAKVNCTMVKEGTVFKSIQNGQEDQKKSVELAKDAAKQAVDEAKQAQNKQSDES